jgi:hypothetical protein
MNQQSAVASRPVERSSRWAPWWVYALVIVPANLGKEQFLADSHWSLRAVLTATIVVGGIAVITAIHRTSGEARIP